MVDTSSLIIDVRSGEQLLLDGEQQVTVELIQKSGRLARLRVIAPKSVRINKIEQEVRCAEEQSD